MATLTIRDLDDDVRQRLRVRAAEHGRSMEAEARAILSEAVSPVEMSLIDAIARFREQTGGVEPGELKLRPDVEYIRDPFAGRFDDDPE